MYLLAYFTALNVFADPKVINTATTVIESGSSYTGGSGYAALHVSASGAYYHGEIGNNVRITTNDGLESIIPHEGLYAAGSGTLLVTGTGVSVRSTSNAASVAGGYLDLGRGTELATQFMTIALNTGTIVGVDTKATSQQSGGIRVVNGNDSYLHLVNPNIQVENTVIAIAGSRTAGGDTVHIEGGSIISTAGELIRSGSNSDGIMMNSGTVIIKNTKVSLGSDNLLVSSGSTSVHLIAEDTDLPGNIIGSDTAIIDVTLSGPGSSITGDVFQNDAAVVTVTLNSGATGSGGYTGGNLITGGDSTWTFDKDSRGNYGENNGTWNIGDYNVTFDNLDHNGTVTISVNSDTGEGGSITVIDTADGDGTIHINTTGNGQADPNQVLPNIVSGDGTEHWQWDPIDWGIDTIIKDGDHFIKSGVSPAGAVLNSSVAIQQAMWFAQQNSLLKRMGELRYGARASRPPAGGTPALHELIENLWLRSYGQQLNVGSQVSGKAYEQLIYGVDLGTDHKFTLSADSDLYLGVYAGYGRSD
ncbi:MAG: hypothetical protein LBK76_00275, partial [Verrucomicrobiales bacterium]|nr:hypothetical protein [Verrucomicrobiales bacterium]